MPRFVRFSYGLKRCYLTCNYVERIQHAQRSMFSKWNIFHSDSIITYKRVLWILGLQKLIRKTTFYMYLARKQRLNRISIILDEDNCHILEILVRLESRNLAWNHQHWGTGRPHENTTYYAIWKIFFLQLPFMVKRFSTSMQIRKFHKRNQSIKPRSLFFPGTAANMRPLVNSSIGLKTRNIYS